MRAGQLLRRVRRLRRRLAAAGAHRPPAADRPPFGLDWERRYLSHYLTCEPSRFHRQLLGDLANFHLARGQRRAYRGPRGSAKTTHISKAYPLWAALEGVEPLTLLLAETGEQAVAYLRSIKAEVAGNPAVARDYPGSAGEGPVWRDDRVVLRNGCAVVARGAAGRVLGLTHGPHRPTLVVGDDLNQRADAYSPTLRRRKLDWFLRDVMNVGGPATNFLVAGTSIHREAVVCELSRNGNWHTRRFANVARWPDRMDLWREWERAAANLGDPDRLTRAREFYDANRAEMHRGAEVLWPEREPLYALMLKRAEIGPRPFASEQQDEEGTDGAAEWPAEYFDRPGFFFDAWPADLVCRLQSLDPSKGRTAKPGDYQAHVQLGMDRRGTLWFDADLRREPVTDMVGRALDLAAGWGPAELLAETNSTMGLLIPELERQLADRRRAGRALALNYLEVSHADPKLARIRSVGGYLSRGQVRVRNTPGGRLLADQWRDVPAGEYDDGPDAAGTLVRRLQDLYAGA